MAGDYEAAKAQAARTREQLATTITFWRDHERDDAIGFLRATVAKIADLDATLSAEMIDPADVVVLAAEIDAAYQACHSCIASRSRRQ